MRNITALSLSVVVILAVLGCQNQLQDPMSPENEMALKKPGKGVSASSAHSSAPNRNFRTHLSSEAEVPPVDSRATGQAIFQFSKDGTELQYKLIAANIENVLMSHIHNAPSGVNGAVVVWLYPASPPPVLIPGRFDGVLAEGVITANDLVGPLAGGDLSDLKEILMDGEAYVNVHTTQNPAGEIRGQIH